MIRIDDVTEDPRHRERFIRFGWELQRSLPNAIPPLLDSERALLDERRNFFFRHGGRLKAFLALDHRGHVLARIGAMVPADLATGESLGWVGLFQGYENYPAFEALMDRAVDWLRRRGCAVAWGPVDFSIWHRYRFATDGFDCTPFIGEPRNPPYYPRFFERYGYSRRFAWRSDLLGRAAMEEMAERYAPHWILFERAGYRETFLDEANAPRLMDSVFALIQASYTAFPGFSMISRKEFGETFAHLPRLLDPELSRVIVDPAGNHVGFVLVMRDLTEALRAMRGRTDLLAKLRFWRLRRCGRIANLYQAGVRPEAMRAAVARGREAGGTALSLARAVFHRIFSSVLASRDYDYAMVSLMRAGNPVGNHTAEHAIDTRHYHLYGLELS